MLQSVSFSLGNDRSELINQTDNLRLVRSLFEIMLATNFKYHSIYKCFYAIC